MAASQQSTPFLQGDLTPRQSDLVDLRNDNAGDKMQQMQSIVLRYLGSQPVETLVDLEGMVSDITRRYPFHGDSVEAFRLAVKALAKEGWVKIDGSKVRLDKIARVARRYLASILRAER